MAETELAMTETELAMTETELERYFSRTWNEVWVSAMARRNVGSGSAG